MCLGEFLFQKESWGLRIAKIVKQGSLAMNESILNFPYTWHFSSSIARDIQKILYIMLSLTSVSLTFNSMFLSCFPLPKKPGKTETAGFFWMPVVYFRLFLGKNSCEIITCCHQNSQLHGVLRWTCAWWEPTMLQGRSQILRLRLMSPAVLLRMKELGLGSWGNCCDTWEFVGGFFCDFYNWVHTSDFSKEDDSSLHMHEMSVSDITLILLLFLLGLCHVRDSFQPLARWLQQYPWWHVVTWWCSKVHAHHRCWYP